VKQLLCKMISLSVNSRAVVAGLTTVICLVALATGVIDGNWRATLRVVIPAGLLAGALGWLRYR